MKSILTIAVLVAGHSFAANPSSGGSFGPIQVYQNLRDSAMKADSLFIALHGAERDSIERTEHQKDSVLFANKLPDSVRAKIDAASKAFRERKDLGDALRSATTVDTLKLAEFRAGNDSLRRTWDAKRDSQIAKLKDPAIQSRVKARIAEIDRHRVESWARIEARRLEIAARIADLRARLKAAAPLGK